MESRTGRRLIGASLAILAAASCALGLARASAGPAQQRGVFALLGGSPKIVSEFWAVHGSGLTATLKVRQFRLDAATPIRDYDVDMQRLIHLIVVRDDFATFAHLHPAFDTTTGTFEQTFTKDANHRYYVYADTMPRGIGQQVFRFTVESDGAADAAHPARNASAPSATAGPYTVTLERTTLDANRPQSVALAIFKGGKPARDLGLYLGAAAHAVFINTSSLAYVHVHPEPPGAAPMAMGAGTSMPPASQAGPRMNLALPALPAGTYAAWIQFRGARDAVYAAPFRIVSR